MAARFWPIVAYAALGVAAIARGTAGVERRRSLGPPASVRGRRSAGDDARQGGRDRPGADGRGRMADAPWRIPFAGWKDILWRVYDRMNQDHLFTVGAGVVYFCLLALFPALAALVSLYGLVADASTIERNLSALSGILPAGAIQVVHDALDRLVSKSGSGLSVSFVVGLRLFRWT